MLHRRLLDRLSRAAAKKPYTADSPSDETTTPPATGTADTPIQPSAAATVIGSVCPTVTEAANTATTATTATTAAAPTPATTVGTATTAGVATPAPSPGTRTPATADESSAAASGSSLAAHPRAHPGASVSVATASPGPVSAAPPVRETAALAAPGPNPSPSSSSSPSPNPSPNPSPSPNPFRRLGLHGLDTIAPVLLAALATEEPLLLIGPHGTAKSLLLTRVASALRLEHRHYNASLLNFDDLIGFPLPGKGGQLEYARTPATVWGAGAVIFDEVSRCRPEIQNKLFPIIHECRVQGLALEGLRYRWAAMNPPCTDEDDNGYSGSEPLDAALADRFAFVVPMPEWATLAEADQLAIIRAEDSPVMAAQAQPLVEALARARAALPAVRARIAEPIALYVRSLCALLAQAGLVASPRRAGMLYRSILAVNAAATALEPGARPEDATLLAVRNGLPQRAQGIAVPEVKLLAAHRDAWRLVHIPAGDPLGAILCSADPLERCRLAVGTNALGRDDFSRVIADALAQLSVGARDAVIVHLFETGAVGRLNAAVAAQAAERYRAIAASTGFSETLHASQPRFHAWSKVKDLLSRLDPADARAHLRANALAASFARRELATARDAEQAFADYAAAEQRLAAACVGRPA